MSLFNQTNQLGREMKELKKLVESMDIKVKQLQKQVQEKSAVEIEHEDVKRRVYSPHEVVVKTRKGIDWPTGPLGFLYGLIMLIILLMPVQLVLIINEWVKRFGWPWAPYNNQSDSQSFIDM